MCGIAGYIQKQAPPSDTIARMVARMNHRGPDGSGLWMGTCNEWSVALGHCRLAIIDPSGGHQPMQNEDGRLHITFNGEVYGHAAMRARLTARGHRFRTTSDTEAVVHHLEEAGDDIAPALASLDGMFALALWDQSLGRLLLGRDRAGIKPLYYSLLPDGGLVFASELTALMEHPSVGREIDPDALASYFFMDYCMSPGCMIRGVRKLGPAGQLAWSNGQVQVSSYWAPGDSADHSCPRTDWVGRVEHVRRVVDESVQSRLIADVPVGLFLSGGLDSSLVGAMASPHVPKPFKTFSVRLDDPEFDQSNYARLMASHLGSEHIEEYVPAALLLSMLDETLDCLDEPIADPSLLPTYALSRLAARHVKVVLSGDGADELWGGYPTLRAHALAGGYAALPRVVQRRIVEPIVRRLPVRHGYQSLEWKAKRFALRWDDHAQTRHLRWMSNLDLGQLEEATGSFSVGADDLPASFAPFAGHTSSGDLLNDIMRLDFCTYLPGAVLSKVDRASMAHGLEVRPPLLSNSLIDLAFSLPSSVKARSGRTKMILRAGAKGLLPATILERPKMGFPIPLARWLRGPLLHRLDDVLQLGPLWETGLLERGIFRGWRDDHVTMAHDHSRPLWALIVLEHWYRRVVCPGPSAGAGSHEIRQRLGAIN